MRFADLHVHTIYSDSTFSPGEVAAVARDKALSAIAICDHDSIDGVEPCEHACAAFGIEVIPSIEMTVESVDMEMHLLGYFVDRRVAWFREILAAIKSARIARVYAMSEKLKAHGIPVEAEAVFELAGMGTVGRLHVARAMLRTGKVKSFRVAFDKYIGFLKPCYVPYTKFTPQEAIEIILRAGGVPVLAHPDLMGGDAFIPELVSFGLRGLEVYHPDHDPKAVLKYEEISRRHDLLMTGGSDCHGFGKGKVLMGSVRVPYELVDKLREESERIRLNNENG